MDIFSVLFCLVLLNVKLWFSPYLYLPAEVAEFRRISLPFQTRQVTESNGIETNGKEIFGIQILKTFAMGIVVPYKICVLWYGCKYWVY